jgi:hypothetical protein
LDMYHLLFMNSNTMREGRQHEYYWCPLLTSEVNHINRLQGIGSRREEVHHDSGASLRGNCAWIVFELGGQLCMPTLNLLFLNEHASQYDVGK